MNSAVLEECLRKLKKASVEKPRKLTFRGSGLPFCPRAFWIDHWLGPFNETQSFTKDLSLFRGTAVHSCLQKWLGRAGVLFGNWACPQCGATLYDHLGWPGTCPVHTREDLVYQEYDLRYQGFHGFADGLISLGGKVFPKYALLEAKTMKGSAWAELRAPKPEHILQANAYAGIFQRIKKLQVGDIWLWYVNADKPYYDPKVFELAYSEKKFAQMLETMQKIRVMRRQPLSQPPVPPPGICSSTDKNPWCIARGLCTSPQLTTILLKEARTHERKRTAGSRLIKFSQGTDPVGG